MVSAKESGGFRDEAEGRHENALNRFGNNEYFGSKFILRLSMHTGHRVRTFPHTSRENQRQPGKFKVIS